VVFPLKNSFLGKHLTCHSLPEVVSMVNPENGSRNNSLRLEASDLLHALKLMREQANSSSSSDEESDVGAYIFPNKQAH
jgi:hypothetical protein